MTHMAIAERIARHVQTDANGCHVWTGNRDRNGYGIAWSGEKVTTVHRITYELTKGKIPDGLTLDHLCRNRSCCNPDHLEPVTLRENILRSPHSLATINAAKTHCPAGHAYDVENTYIDPRGGRRCRACAREWQRAYLRRRAERAALKAAS